MLEWSKGRLWGLEYASSKEGQHAVNASAFAIAQSCFLLHHTLVHGRWNFMPLSTITVVFLFSFYKNAVMAGFSIVLLLSENVVQWSPSIRRMVNCHSQFCDRDAYRFIGRLLPSVTCPNELITKQTHLSWIALVFVHILEAVHDTITSFTMVVLYRALERRGRTWHGFVIFGVESRPWFVTPLFLCSLAAEYSTIVHTTVQVLVLCIL